MEEQINTENDIDEKDEKPIGYRIRYRKGRRLPLLLFAADCGLMFLSAAIKNEARTFIIFALYIPIGILAALLITALALPHINRKYEYFANGIIAGWVLSLGLYVIQFILVLFFVAMYAVLGDNCEFRGDCKSN